MKYGDTRKSATDLSDWESVERALSRKHSRERRLRAATDLLYDVDTAIRQHEHEHRRLTALTGGDFNADEPEGTHHDLSEAHPSLSEPKEPKEDDLLSLREVARLLGVSYSTVRKKPLRDELPAIKIGARVMVRRSALRKWLEARERKSRGGRVKR